MTNLGFIRKSANDGIHEEGDIEINRIETKTEIEKMKIKKIAKRIYYRMIGCVAERLGGDECAVAIAELMFTLAVMLTVAAAIYLLSTEV